jgi:hypothetical protein
MCAEDVRRHRARFSSAALAVGFVLAARPALAEPVTFDVQMLQRGDTTGCPDAKVLRQEVAARVGAEPFAEGAAQRLTVVLSRDADSFKAEIWYRDAVGHETGPSEVASTNCAELATTIAERLAILIGPVPRPPPPPSRPPPARQVRLGLRAAAGILGSLGAAPAAAFGISAELGLHRGLGAIALEGRADVPAEGHAPQPGVDVRSSLLLASLVPCLLPSRFRLCALASVGALKKTLTGVEKPAPPTTVYVGAGVRAAYSARFLERFAVEPHVDVLGTIVGTKLCTDGGRCSGPNTTVWRSPPVSGAIGISLAGDL